MEPKQEGAKQDVVASNLAESAIANEEVVSEETMKEADAEAGVTTEREKGTLAEIEQLESDLEGRYPKPEVKPKREKSEYQKLQEENKRRNEPLNDTWLGKLSNGLQRLYTDLIDGRRTEDNK